jgi:hypothetical protein
MELTGLSWYELNNAMMDYDGSSSLSLVPKKVALGTKIELPAGSMEEVHRKYLKRRGFDPDELNREYGIYGTGMLGDWKYRIIIPIYDKDGELVSFQGRDYTNKQVLRYKTLSVEESVVNPKFILYNENHCYEDWIIAVEGVFDCLKFGDNCCATLGTTTTEVQVRKLSNYKKVFISFDSEVQAQQRALKLATKLSALGVGDVQIIDLQLENKDMGDMSYDEIQKLKEELQI